MTTRPATGLPHVTAHLSPDEPTAVVLRLTCTGCDNSHFEEVTTLDFFRARHTGYARLSGTMTWLPTHWLRTGRCDLCSIFHYLGVTPHHTHVPSSPLS